ncbi:BlaR1 peptidase M56 [Singulisphaera sp. GP187]|uniref:M56 family metallopeptidase n=1 Tax=Singulisphaera sp. GP187 TaxID=1882752 RepID=UPI0009268E99|nr:M56 family metallopeptidase [Singulisphaera sp. GP187]SIO00922.1 BlaR1 peptidase M56 [Singulisphaera sp. GP187]
MADGIDRLGEMLLDASLSATALLSLVALAMIGCRQPVRRICLARAAILSVLALIPLVILAPFPRVSLNRVAHRSGLFAHPIFANHVRGHLDIKPVGSGQTLTSERALASDGPRPLRGLVGPPPRWLVLLYFAGTASSLGWMLLGYWGLNWLTSRSEEVSPLSAELYESLPVHGRRPRFRVSARVRRPVLVGLFRQSILIPVDLDFPESAEKLRLSLLHELAHAERKDSRFGLASGLAHAFWFFIPPLWWIRAQMKLDQEFMADRRAAQAFGPFQAYAASLVKIASGDPEIRPTATLPTSSPSPTSTSALFQRVLMLVQCPFSLESHPPRWWACSLPGLVLLGTMAASCLTLRVSGVSAPFLVPPQSSAPGGHSFRMSRLVAPSPSPGSETRPRVYELPLPLPQTFDLRVDVWADPDALTQTKVVGIPLVAPGSSPETVAPLAGWHQVRIQRTTDTLTAQLDQRLLPTSAEQETTPALTLESPAGYPVHFRNLRLTW